VLVTVKVYEIVYSFPICYHAISALPEPPPTEGCVPPIPLVVLAHIIGVKTSPPVTGFIESTILEVVIGV